MKNYILSNENLKNIWYTLAAPDNQIPYRIFPIYYSSSRIIFMPRVTGVPAGGL